jgi:peptidyl-prolyl cis-trans isomerase C
LPSIRTSLIGIGITSAFATCSFAQDQTDSTETGLLSDPEAVLATVNGTEITLAHVISLVSILPEQLQSLSADQLYNGVINQLIDQELLYQQFDAAQSPEFALAVENHTRALAANTVLEKLQSVPIDPAEVRARYEERYGNTGSELNASHILLETEAEALEVKKELDAGNDFAELARTRSVGPSAPNGGALGWFGLGAMVPQFEQAAVALEVGDVSDPVQTQFGWHVILLNDRREASVPSLDEVRAQIEAEVRQQRLTEIMDDLRSSADIAETPVDRVDLGAIRRTELIE